jgi:hypothetical protein
MRLEQDLTEGPESAAAAHQWRALYYRTVASVLRSPATTAVLDDGCENGGDCRRARPIEMKILDEALTRIVPAELRREYQALSQGGTLEPYVQCKCSHPACTEAYKRSPGSNPGAIGDVEVLGRLADEYGIALTYDAKRATWLERLQSEFLARCWPCVFSLARELQVANGKSLRLIGEGLALLLAADLERFGIAPPAVTSSAT